MNQELVEKKELSIEVLLSSAVEKGVPVETMERLLVMRRELNSERAKNEYDRDMAEFQMECPVIEKTKEVRTKSGVVAYRYAPIEHIITQVKPLLKQFGFSYSFQTVRTGDGIKAICTIKHTGGHSENSEMEVPLGNKTEIMSQSQVMAAAMTFAKRYAFCNALGILVQDDDNNATPAGKEKKPEEKTEVSVDYLTQVKTKLFKMGATNETQALKLLKEKTGLTWKSFKEATPRMAQMAMGALLSKK